MCFTTLVHDACMPGEANSMRSSWLFNTSRKLTGALLAAEPQLVSSGTSGCAIFISRGKNCHTT